MTQSVAQIGVFKSSAEWIIYFQFCTKGCSSECALEFPPPQGKVQTSPKTVI